MWVPCQCSIKAEIASNTERSVCRSEEASESTRIRRCGCRWRVFQGNLSLSGWSGSSWGGWRRKSSLSRRFIRTDSWRTIVLLPNTQASDISVTIVSLLHCYSPSQIIAPFMRILFWIFRNSKSRVCWNSLGSLFFRFRTHFPKLEAEGHRVGSMYC